MSYDQEGDPDRQQHHVQPVHRAYVQDVDQGSRTRGVHSIFGVDGDELCVEVLLREVPGEGGEDADSKNDDADHPCGGATVSPTGHEVLTPQMQDHEDEEQLHRPEVEAVEEPAQARVMPPLRAHERKYDAAHDDPDQGRDGDNTEDVDPRADVVGLSVWQQMVHREVAVDGPAKPQGPTLGRAR